MFHGSHNVILELIKPHVSFDYKPLVYATDNWLYALVRSGVFDFSSGIIKEDYTGTHFTLIEATKGAFNLTFNTFGYIYSVCPSYFTKSGLEYISTTDVPVISGIYFPNILQEMRKHTDFFDLILFDDSEKYWDTINGGIDGYLERRKLREAERKKNECIKKYKEDAK